MSLETSGTYRIQTQTPLLNLNLCAKRETAAALRLKKQAHRLLDAPSPFLWFFPHVRQ